MDMSGGHKHTQFCNLKGRSGLETGILNMLVSKIIVLKVVLNKITILTLNIISGNLCRIEFNRKLKTKLMVVFSIFTNYHISC